MDMLATEALIDRTAARLGPGARLAALDLGTNNCRLLVAEITEDGLIIVDSFSRIVRLGEGLARTGRLGDPAMARTLAALKVCARIIERHRVAGARCVATEACRRAANGAEFIRRVERVTGLALEVLRQEEEARLAMLGCLPLADPLIDRIMMVDIGGGSTEIMWVDRRSAAEGEEPGTAISLPLGVVTLSETLGSEVDAAAYGRMVDLVEGVLDEKAPADSGPLAAASAPAALPDLQMLGTSGTVTTLAAIHLGLRRYDRRKVDGLAMRFEDVTLVSERLRALDNATRAAHPCIGHGRADLVVAGCAILDAVHRRWPVEWLRVADRGVREGLLSTLMGWPLSRALADGPAFD
jgi:exopolyphosphatase/guanosine-5'-triphosphate,3'-diphosphate pyrophosphatase